MREVPKHNLLLLCGDINAQVGPEAGKHNFHESSNRNGELLCEL